MTTNADLEAAGLTEQERETYWKYQTEKDMRVKLGLIDIEQEIATLKKVV